MALLLKEGVKLTRVTNGVTYGVSPEILLAIQVAEGQYQKCNIADMTITSILDGTHKDDSFHYIGKAVDLRTKGTGLTSRLFDMIKKALPMYDVILEDNGGANEHIHIEADFK